MGSKDKETKKPYRMGRKFTVEPRGTLTGVQNPSSCEFVVPFFMNLMVRVRENPHVDIQGQTVDFLLTDFPLNAKDTLTGLELVHLIRKGQGHPLAIGSKADQLNAVEA